MAGRPAHPPSTALGVVLRAKRGTRTQREAAPEIGVDRVTLTRIERGTHAPSMETARALATWLGWTMERVMDAAKEPPSSLEDTMKDGGER